MKQMKIVIPHLLFLTLLVSSCTPEPVPISYGNDACHYCKMNIVDQQHAAELVTTKGKVFTFDAIECMLNYKQENENTDYAFELINDFNAPGKLIDASTSYYLISKDLPSPMGANLTAFLTEEAAIQMLNLKKGQVFSWRELQDHLLAKK
jgi:copper chaperone NosL